MLVHALCGLQLYLLPTRKGKQECVKTQVLQALARSVPGGRHLVRGIAERLQIGGDAEGNPNRGRRTVKVEPDPGWLATETVPPSCSTRARVTYRPSPRPP